VLAQQCRRRDKEGRPALPAEQCGQRGQHSAIGREYRGRATWRRSTASWWRSTAISTSFSSGVGPRRTRSRSRRTSKNVTGQLM
jgi:hypothetical protein